MCFYFILFIVRVPLRFFLAVNFMLSLFWAVWNAGAVFVVSRICHFNPFAFSWLYTLFFFSSSFFLSWRWTELDDKKCTYFVFGVYFSSQVKMLFPLQKSLPFVDSLYLSCKLVFLLFFFFSSLILLIFTFTFVWFWLLLFCCFMWKTHLNFVLLQHKIWESYNVLQILVQFRNGISKKKNYLVSWRLQ